MNRERVDQVRAMQTKLNAPRCVRFTMIETDLRLRLRVRLTFGLTGNCVTAKPSLSD